MPRLQANAQKSHNGPVTEEEEEYHYGGGGSSLITSGESLGMRIRPRGECRLTARSKANASEQNGGGDSGILSSSTPKVGFAMIYGLALSLQEPEAETAS